MKSQPHPRALTEGIRDLGTALFTNSGQSLIRLPSDVIRFHILQAEHRRRPITPHPTRKPFQHVLTEIFPIVRPRPRPLAFLSGPILPV